MSDLLTDDEKKALELTGQLAGLFGRIVGNAPSRSGDLNEAVLHIHNLQHMLMAQAAARSYPTEFRLLGEVLGEVLGRGGTHMTSVCALTCGIRVPAASSCIVSLFGWECAR